MTRRTTHKINTTGVNDGSVIGAATWWDIPPKRIESAIVESALRRNGFYESFNKITTRRAFTKSLDAVKADGYNVMKISEDDYQAIYGIVKVIGNKREQIIDIENVNAVIYEKETRIVRFKIVDAMGDKIAAFFTDAQDQHDEDDLRRLVKRVLKNELNAVTMKQNGGVYFVLAQYALRLDSLKHAVNEIGGDVFIVDIANNAKSQESTNNAVRQELIDDAAMLKEELEILLANRQSSSTDLLAKRLTKFDELRGKAMLYREALRTDIKGIEKSINTLESTVRNAMGIDEWIDI